MVTEQTKSATGLRPLLPYIIRFVDDLGYRQEKQKCVLDFIVEKGEEQPMFQVVE